MRPAHRLLLALAMALTALAMSATTASGDTPVEIHDEDTGVHCNPCFIEAHGESQVLVTSVGIPIFTCEETLHGEIYEDGSGHITALINTLNHAGQPCNTANCNGVGEPAGESEWPLQIEEDAGELTMTYLFCLEPRSIPNIQGAHCHAPTHLEEHTPHHYEISMDHDCPNINRTFVGEWEIEGTPIEIEHPAA